MAEKTLIPAASDVQAIVDLVKTNAHAELVRIGDNLLPLVLAPEGYKLTDIGAHLSVPTAARGSTTFHDLESLIAYVNEEKDQTSRAYYVARPNPSLVVVLNDTKRAIASLDRTLSWRDFRATFAFPMSPEWTLWNASNKVKMGQADFAAFIEQNLPDIASPDIGRDGPTGAQMLEVALTLEAKANVNYSSAIRLDNGSREFTFEETVQGSAVKGRYAIPEKFELGIPVFENGSGYRIPVFLRYKLAGSTLQLWYELDRPQVVLDLALTEAIDTFKSETSVPVYRGQPATGRRGE